MTMTTDIRRDPFEPVGEQSRRQMIHDGIASMRPLEPGTVITHDMIAEWIGEPFPIPRPIRGGEFVIPDYGPMDAVKLDLLRSGVHLVAVANVGWRVATHAEMVVDAEQAWRDASTKLGRAALIARGVNPARVEPCDAARARAIDADVLAERRVMTARARERARQASRW